MRCLTSYWTKPRNVCKIISGQLEFRCVALVMLYTRWYNLALVTMYLFIFFFFTKHSHHILNVNYFLRIWTHCVPFFYLCWWCIFLQLKSENPYYMYLFFHFSVISKCVVIHTLVIIKLCIYVCYILWLVSFFCNLKISSRHFMNELEIFCKAIFKSLPLHFLNAILYTFICNLFLPLS